MKTLPNRLIVLSWLFGVHVGWLDAVEVGHVDDFESSLAGWTGDNPTLVATGGPGGADDGFVMLRARGGGGTGSKLATYNQSPVWIGDFGTADVSAIELDFKNDTTSSGPLSMRLVLFGPGSLNNRWTSIDPIIVPNDGQWQRLSFPIDAESLTRVQGSSVISYEDMIENVVRVQVRHNSGTPDEHGTPVVATAGVDNMRIVGGVPDDSDFNGDGVLDVRDIDLLLVEVRLGQNPTRFDRTKDGLVNDQDILHVVTLPGELNTYIGDADLDGEFNSTDLVQVLAAGEYEDTVTVNSTWATGDWNGDGEFDTSDLVSALAAGGYEAGPRPVAAVAAVPEPTGGAAILLGIGIWMSLSVRRAG
jgi:hypothetical protein